MGEDEVNQSILESAISSSTRDPMQAHNLEQEEVVDSSLEYASLLPVSGDLMPDDELDIATASTLPSLTFQAAASNQAEDYDDQDEFLPSEARQTASIALTSESDIYPSLDKHESEESEEDEFAASLMAVAAKENVAEEPVIRRRKASAALEDMDD